MNIQELNKAIPNVHQIYAEKLQALRTRMDVDHSKVRTDRENSIIKSLSLGMTATLIGAATLVTATATVPVLMSALAVGTVSLGKAIYHIFEKSNHEKHAQLIEDYRSGALEEQLSMVSLWDRIKSNVTALTKAITPPVASIEPAQVATSLAENIDARLQGIYTRATGREADYESTFDWISGNPFEKVSPQIAVELLNVASSRGLLDQAQVKQAFEALSVKHAAAARQELTGNAPRPAIRRQAVASGLEM